MRDNRQIDKNDKLQKISCTQTHEECNQLIIHVTLMESETKWVVHAVVAAGAGAGGSAAGAGAAAGAAAGAGLSFCNWSIIFCFSMNI